MLAKLARLGRPNTWGYIEPDSWRTYAAEKVHHVFNPKRFSYTRGEPALTSAVETIDKVTRYFDAELVAANVNACLSIFITHEDELGLPVAAFQRERWTGPVNSRVCEAVGRNRHRLVSHGPEPVRGIDRRHCRLLRTETGSLCVD